MNLIADTNLIIRVLTRDDPAQFAIATRALDDSELVVFSIVALCEAAWVLRQVKRWPTRDVAYGLRLLLDDPRAVYDRDLVGAGLAMLDAGGDFADAVIAVDGRRHADAPFATFDKQAARLLEAQGVAVTLLG